MKRTMKSLTLSAATALLSLTLVGQSLAATTNFTDIDKSAAKDSIILLQQNGIVDGVTPTLFAPDESVTAAQTVQLFVKAFGLNLDLIRFVKEPKATDYFAKASNDAWYSQAFIIAAVNNIDLPKDLDPSKKLSREAFTHLLVHAIEVHNNLPLINPVVVDIKDTDQIDVNYSGSIQRALKYGIIKLNADGSFSPKAEITRADAAVEIFNALAYLKAHQQPVQTNDPITATQSVQLITDALHKLGSDIQIKIDPEAKVTRESFTAQLIQLFQSSGKLPMLKLVPVDIKDNDKIDILNSGAIQTALALKIVTLQPDGTFNPQASLTLAEATEMTDRAVLAAEKLPSSK